MKHLYLLSGLGADHRVFEYLDLSRYVVHHVRWIPPLGKETMADYATRLIEQIKTERPVLIGVSFGGMMAVEIAKQKSTDKIIIISSARTKSDFPLLLRIVGRLRLHRLLPITQLKKVNSVTCRLFGAETGQEKDLLKAIMRDTDESFLRWALNSFSGWNNQVSIPNVVHIHGTRDRIIPFRSADYPIHGGGHFMIVNRAKEIENLIGAILKD